VCGQVEKKKKKKIVKLVDIFIFVLFLKGVCHSHEPQHERKGKDRYGLSRD
jgi:hypothetical protein